MMKQNQDIRDYMADHNVTQRMMALAMDTSVWSINKKLQVEMTEKEKEDWLITIDAISASEDTLDETEQTETTNQTEPVEGSEDVSMTTRFQIGDLVKLPSKENKIGTVRDIWHSMSQDKLMYAVEIEGEGHCGLYAEDHLEPAPIPTEYTFEAHIDGNVAVVTMNAKQGDKEWVYARGHAHILHDGEVGKAQAVSFAARRMFETLDKKQQNKIYFKGVSQ